MVAAHWRGYRQPDGGNGAAARLGDPMVQETAGAY